MMWGWGAGCTCLFSELIGVVGASSPCVLKCCYLLSEEGKLPKKRLPSFSKHSKLHSLSVGSGMESICFILIVKAPVIYSGCQDRI